MEDSISQDWMLTELRQLLRDESFCDLDIVAGSSTVRCHALVIASALPRLGKILLDLGRPSEDVITVILAEVKVECVKK